MNTILLKNIHIGSYFRLESSIPNDMQIFYKKISESGYFQVNKKGKGIHGEVKHFHSLNPLKVVLTNEKGETFESLAFKAKQPTITGKINQKQQSKVRYTSKLFLNSDVKRVNPIEAIVVEMVKTVTTKTIIDIDEYLD